MSSCSCHTRPLIEELDDCHILFSKLTEDYKKLQIQLNYIESKCRTVNEDEDKYITSLLSAVASLFHNNQSHYSDLIILLEGGHQIFGHKLILSSQSFNDWNNIGLQQLEKLDLTGVSYDVANALIKWVYTGELQPNMDEFLLIQLLQQATKFQLQALYIRCQKMLILLVNIDNWSMLYQTAEETSADILKDFCINFNSGVVDVSTVQTHSPVPDISTPIDNQICVKTCITANDNIVRCICKDPSERGEMVCCDRCCVWQHVECIDIEISTVPEKYYCERCQLSPNLISTTSISESVRCGGTNLHSTDVLLNTDVKTVKYGKSSRTSHKRKKVGIKSSNNRNILMDAADSVEESPDIETNYNCKLCGQNFKNDRVLQNHTRRHMSNSLCCDLCDKMFKTIGELKRHGRIHSGEKPYVCDICGKSFRFGSNLTAHIRIHTGKKPHKCDVCNKTFNTKTHLKTHKFVHSGEKPYKCDVCSKTFSKNNHLKEHTRIHTKQKPYSCGTCSKSFTTRGNLLKHIRIHSGEKPYKCDVCCKSFSQNGTLQKHVTIHTGQRLFICDVCGKTYKSSADLKQHQAVHSGDQPYKCNICCKSFFYSRYLETHRRSHSGERPFICDVCGKSFITNSHLHRHIKISCVKQT